MSPGKQLRELVAEATIQVPGAPSALLARLIERCGYDAMYLSGAAFSAGVLGLPDVGLFTLTELVQQATYLTRACALAADRRCRHGLWRGAERRADGHRAGSGRRGGDPARRPAVSQAVRPSGGQVAGRAGGHVRQAAGRGRGREGDPDLVHHRPDRRPRRDRASTTRSSGPSATSMPAPTGFFPRPCNRRTNSRSLPEAIDAPLVANMTEFGKSPLLTLEELAELGYSAVLYPVTLLRVAMKASEAALNLIAADGTQADILDLMQTREELYDLLDYQAFEATRPELTPMTNDN